MSRYRGLSGRAIFWDRNPGRWPGLRDGRAVGAANAPGCRSSTKRKLTEKLVSPTFWFGTGYRDALDHSAELYHAKTGSVSSNNSYPLCARRREHNNHFIGDVSFLRHHAFGHSRDDEESCGLAVGASFTLAAAKW